jgi:hypothetical protein
MTSTPGTYLALFLGLFALAASACEAERSKSSDDDDGGAGGATSGAGAGSTVPGGPEVTLMVSPASLTDGETVTFTATVTDPDGFEDIGGGLLKNEDGSLTYAPFVQLSAGTFAVDLSWNQLHQLDPIAFDSELVKTFRADFTDTTNKVGSGVADLTLTCGGCPTEAGQCLCQGCLGVIDTACEECAIASCPQEASACAELSECDGNGEPASGCMALALCVLESCPTADLICVQEQCAAELSSTDSAGIAAAQALGDCVASSCSAECGGGR